jgi:hypothetical protein
MKKHMILLLSVLLTVGSVSSTETEDQAQLSGTCLDVIKKVSENTNHRMYGIGGGAAMLGTILTASGAAPVGIPIAAAGVIFGGIQRSQIRMMDLLTIADMLSNDESELSKIPLGESIDDVNAVEKRGIKVYGKQIRKFLEVKKEYSKRHGTEELTNAEFAELLLESDTEAGLSAGKNPFCKRRVTSKGKVKYRFRGLTVKRLSKALSNAIVEESNDEIDVEEEETEQDAEGEGEEEEDEYTDDTRELEKNDTEELINF